MTEPPDGMPRYQLLTGPADEAFCQRVSEALAAGYELAGSPAIAMQGTQVIVGQALVWPTRRPSGAQIRPA